MKIFQIFFSYVVVVFKRSLGLNCNSTRKNKESKKPHFVVNCSYILSYLEICVFENHFGDCCLRKTNTGLHHLNNKKGRDLKGRSGNVSDSRHTHHWIKMQICMNNHSNVAWTWWKRWCPLDDSLFGCENIGKVLCIYCSI